MPSLSLPTVFLLAALTAAPSDAAVPRCLAGLWGRIVGGPRVTDTSPPLPPLLFTRADAPPFPEAMQFDAVSVKEDPNFPGTYLYRVKTKPGIRLVAGFESGQFVPFVGKFPKFPAKLGMRIEEDGTVEYPDVAGVNARVKKLREAKDPEAPALYLWEDPSPNGATQLDIARAWAGGMVPQSLNGKSGLGQSLHFHDMMVHNLAYLMLPPEIVLRQRARIEILLTLREHPVLQQNAPFQRFVETLLEKEVSEKLEFTSATLLRNLVGPRGKEQHLNLQLGSLIPLGYGDRRIWGDLTDRDSQFRLTTTQNKALERVFANAKYNDLSAEATATELENRFP